ncbi:uncharacterized protein THITE_2077835 [Thermothielavioides terrestris NRRL 8126]|uniref:Rhodopsin domain-containing protein n=1 Tax=Thermothielavioides terrestris (strain ATCC 38088 / NRRL 8126) TaxID=578455 RepID=G2QZ64_THETT|nr:uncharacterized protein THITE_2077835 [Thermothielavioides terrestris NRRL 8126]AEO66300.1 hypothetical protein THITE_2077835 [Thermothielavioides terrestris NRRL 8126]
MSSSSPGGPAGASASDLDHSDLRPNMLAATWITWTIALIFVLLRLWTRTRIVHTLGISDWFIVLSLIAAGGCCISIVEQCKHGMGIHLYDIDLPVDYSPLMEVRVVLHGGDISSIGLTLDIQAWWFSLLFYVLSLAITKVSICLLYLTIFTLPWARRACYLVLAIVVLTSLFSVAATLTDCIPLQAVWDPTVTPSFCQPQDTWWANTGCVIATDWMIFILPIPMVLPLKLPTRQKLIVVGVFAVGFFVCLVSLIRLVILIRTEAPGAGPDFTYIGADLLYWTVIEVHTAIVVACAMTLKPLAARLFPRLLADSPPRDTLQTSDLNTTVGHASGGRPPTIGSRPARAAAGEYMAQVRGKLGGEGGRIGDVEAAVRGAAGREDGKRDTSGLELLPGSSPGSESSTIGKTDAEVVALVLRSSWMK